MLAGAEYLSRHNALMVLAVNWAKEKGLLPENTVWYGKRWKKGHVVKGKEFKLYWDFEYKMRKTSTARGPNMTLENVIEKRIWIVDMPCPQEKNIEVVTRTKLKKYQQHMGETREKRPGYAVEVVPVIIRCLGGDVERMGKVLAKLIKGERNVIRIVRTMQHTVLLEGETITRKVLVVLYTENEIF